MIMDDESNKALYIYKCTYTYIDNESDYNDYNDDDYDNDYVDDHND